MAAAIFERMGLNAREQRLAQVLIIVFGVMLFLGLPLGLESYVASKRSSNDELRQALEDVQTGRAAVRDREAKKEAIAMRYQSKAPELAGFLEQEARKQKLEVTDSVDRPPVPHGKRYTERSTIIHLKKAGLLAISEFMQSIEQSESPISINRLNIRKRTGEPDSYDVEMGVSAYDRVEKPAAAASSAAPKGGKP